MVDTETGITEKTLAHEGNRVREFYAALEGPMVVAIEATGAMQWFLQLLVRDRVPGEQRLLLLHGHTAIAVLEVAEIARMRARVGLAAAGVLIAIFEIATVLVLRAHYTIDVFTGIVTGLYAAHLAGCISSVSKGK